MNFAQKCQQLANAALQAHPGASLRWGQRGEVFSLWVGPPGAQYHNSENSVKFGEISRV